MVYIYKMMVFERSNCGIVGNYLCYVCDMWILILVGKKCVCVFVFVMRL